jgi:hypothetical protein
VNVGHGFASISRSRWGAQCCQAPCRRRGTLSGLSDAFANAPPPDRFERFKQSGKIPASSRTIPISFHVGEFGPHGSAQRITIKPGIGHQDQRRLFHFSKRDFRLYPRWRRASAVSIQSVYGRSTSGRERDTLTDCSRKWLSARKLPGAFRANGT